MPEAPALTKVTQHLKTLAQQTANISDMKVRREYIDRYFFVTEALDHNVSSSKFSINGCTAYWVSPAQLKTERRMLYIHGGSWMSGSIKGYHQFMTLMAEACQCHILFIEYALLPESPFPAGLNDCVSAYKWLRTHTPSSTTVNNEVFIAGDSAGGNLCLATLLACKKENIPLAQAAIALSPCTDLSFQNDSIKTHQHLDPIINGQVLPRLTSLYTQNTICSTQPLVSPIHGDLEGLPPLLIQTGTAEVLLDDSIKFAEKARLAGVNVELDLWDNMPHVFQGFAPQLPEANDAIDKIASFIQRH